MRRAGIVALGLVVLVSAAPTYAKPPPRKPIEQVYANLWRQASPFFGGSQQAPAFDPSRGALPGTDATVYYDTGPPTVALSGKTQRLLTTPAKGSKVRRTKRANARQSLVHEWDHVYQPGELKQSDPQGAEQLANVFAARVSNKLGWGKVELQKSALKPVAQSLKAKYGPGFISRGQFGDNYGQDPQSIVRGRKQLAAMLRGSDSRNAQNPR